MTQHRDEHLHHGPRARRARLQVEYLETRDLLSGGLPDGLRWDTLQLADFGGSHVQEVVVQGQDGAWHIGPSGNQQWQFGSLNAFTGTRLVVGDFNGDGKSDVAGLTPGGRW